MRAVSDACIWAKDSDIALYISDACIACEAYS